MSDKRIRWPDPLQKLVIKRRAEIKRHIEERWALMFKHIEGWTLIEVCYDRRAAKAAMAHHREGQPNFKYKIVPCQVWIAKHHIASPELKP